MRDRTLDRSHDRFAVPAWMFDQMNKARKREHPRDTLHRLEMENHARAFFHESARVNAFGEQLDDVAAGERQPASQPRVRELDGGFVLLAVKQFRDRADETMRHVKRRFCTGVPPFLQRLRDEQVRFGNRIQLRMLAEHRRAMRGERERRAEDEDRVGNGRRGVNVHCEKRRGGLVYSYPNRCASSRTSAENSRPSSRQLNGPSRLCDFARAGRSAGLSRKNVSFPYRAPGGPKHA